MIQYHRKSEVLVPSVTDYSLLPKKDLPPPCSLCTLQGLQGLVDSHDIEHFCVYISALIVRRIGRCVQRIRKVEANTGARRGLSNGCLGSPAVYCFSVGTGRRFPSKRPRLSGAQVERSDGSPWLLSMDNDRVRLGLGEETPPCGDNTTYLLSGAVFSFSDHNKSRFAANQHLGRKAPIVVGFVICS